MTIAKFKTYIKFDRKILQIKKLQNKYVESRRPLLDENALLKLTKTSKKI